MPAYVAHRYIMSSTKTRAVVFITIPEQLVQRQHIAETHEMILE